MTSVATPDGMSATAKLDAVDVAPENAAMLCYSILDHRLARRDQYEGVERTAYVAEAIREARLALDGASIETILESRCA